MVEQDFQRARVVIHRCRSTPAVLPALEPPQILLLAEVSSYW
jgi:hypothetical protein